MAKKKAEKKDDDVVKIYKFRQELAVGLTREEVEAKSQLMATRVAEIDVKKAEFSELAKNNRSRLAEMETDIRRLSNAVRDKAEIRGVSCERIFNYTTGRVRDVRVDTGDVLSERDMTDDERQRDLPIGEGGDIDDDFAEDPDAEEPEPD
jgi:ferritin-like protein